MNREMMTPHMCRTKVFFVFLLLLSFGNRADARKVQMAVATFSQSRLTMDGSLPPRDSEKVLEFVLKIQGIKDPVAAEKVFDFSPVRKIRADLEAKKWKPLP